MLESLTGAASLSNLLPPLLLASPSLFAPYTVPLKISAMEQPGPPLILRPMPIDSEVLPSIPVTHDHRRNFSEQCAVCGDRATGFHYHVASCNGCKTFFRRTIMCNRRFKCKKDGNCDFNKDIRCACRACRFQKCVAVGMNSHAIQGSRTNRRKSRRTLGTVVTPPDDDSRVVSPTSAIPSLASRPITPLSSTSSASPAPAEEIKAFSIGDAECDEMISSMLNIDARMSQLKCLYFAGGPLLDLLTAPPAIECMQDIQPSSPPSSFASDEKRIEYWLNYELTIATEWMKTHACTLMEDTMVAIVLLNSACQAALRGERELRYPDGSAMLFSHQCGDVRHLVDAIVRSSMDKATFVLMRALTFLNPDSLGLTPDGCVKINGERRRVMHALGTYIFRRNGNKSAGLLGEVLTLPATALALGHRIRQSPPAPAPLLFVKEPLPNLKH